MLARTSITVLLLAGLVPGCASSHSTDDAGVSPTCTSEAAMPLPPPDQACDLLGADTQPIPPPQIMAYADGSAPSLTGTGLPRDGVYVFEREDWFGRTDPLLPLASWVLELRAGLWEVAVYDDTGALVETGGGRVRQSPGAIALDLECGFYGLTVGSYSSSCDELIIRVDLGGTAGTRVDHWRRQ